MNELGTTQTPGEFEESMDDLQFTIDMAREAGDYIRDAIGDAIETQWKVDNTPVTNIDMTVNSLILRRIKEKYPNDHVYGEEESSEVSEGSEYTWTVDPIDGTQALGKLDTFTVCIAKLDSDGQPILSVIYNPSRDELYTARKGEQSYLNGEPLKVSEKEMVKSSYVHFGSALRFEDLVTNGIAYDRIEGQGAKIFNTRSLAHGCVEVAKGEFEGAYIGVKTPFEAAAVKLIIEGAGGKVTDLYGRNPGRLDGEIRGLVVSNGLIHDKLVEALSVASQEQNTTSNTTSEITRSNSDLITNSVKSRTEKPSVYPERFPVPEDKVGWNTGYSYAPEYFVAEIVLAEDSTVKAGGWADPEDIDLLTREIHSYEGDVQFDDQGHPRNPLGRTGLKGRGLLGKWGANFAADPIISRINPETGVFEVVVIERSDTHELAIPGGMVDEGEDVSRTVEREFQEEAGASVDMSLAQLVYQGYVDDPRNTDNAWMETTAKHLHLGEDQARKLTLEAGDDAKAVRWLKIDEEALSNLYASHGPMILKAVELFMSRDSEVSNDVRDQLGNLISA